MDNELDLGRYSSAFRRRRRLIALAVAVGAVLGLAVTLRAPLVSSASLIPIDRSAELASAGIDPGNIDIAQVLGQVAATLNSDSFDDQLESGTSADAHVVVMDEAAVVVLTVSASSRAALDSVLELASSTSASVYGSELTTRLEGIADNYNDSLDSLRSRLVGLEDQANAAGDDQTTLIEGLLLAAESTRSALAIREDQITALDRITSRLDGDLRQLEVSEPSRARSPLVMVAVGGLGAGLVALGGVAVLAAFDRSIRTRRDLERIGLTNLLGVVPLDSDDLAVVAGAIRQAAIRTGAGSVQLVPVTRASMIPLAEHLSVAHLSGVVDRHPLGVDASETMHSSADALNIVKVAWGEDTSIMTAVVSNQLSAASDVPIGVILVGVPESELPYVER